jgi:hypothetical protein
MLPIRASGRERRHRRRREQHVIISTKNTVSPRVCVGNAPDPDMDPAEIEGDRVVEHDVGGPKPGRR